MCCRIPLPTDDGRDMSKHKSTSTNDVIAPELTAAMLEAVAPVTPPAGLRARVLERARARPAIPDFKTLRTMEGWRVMAPGVEYKLLAYDETAHSKSFLLRAQPGVALPAHAHDGDEECLVLEGEFSIGDLNLRAGDFHFAPRGSQHPAAHTQRGVLVYLRSCLRDYPAVAPE